LNAGERAPSGLRARIERDLKQETAEIMTAFAGLIPPDLRARAEDADAIATALQVDTPAELKWILSASAPSEKVAEPRKQRDAEGESEPAADKPARGSERYERVIELLEEHGPLARSSIQQDTGFSTGTFYRAIEVLGDRITKLPDGRYVLAGTDVQSPVSKPSATPKPKPASEQAADATSSTSEPRTYTRSDGSTRRTPTHPGIEAVPEHLRIYPAAQAGGPLKQRIAAAEVQEKVFTDLKAHPNSLGPEIAMRTGLGKSPVLRHLRALADAGLVEYTGETRSRLDAPGTKPGNVVRAVVNTERTGTLPPPTSARPQDVERVDTDGESASSAKPRPTQRPGVDESTPGDSRSRSGNGASGSETLTDSRQEKRPPQVAEAIAKKVPTRDENRKDREELGGDGAKLLAQVRDYMTDVAKEGQLVTPATISGAMEISREVVLACLLRLAEQGKIKDLSVPGMPAFAYQKPTEPGRAAELDRERARQRSREEFSGTGRADGVEVAGTGRPMRTGNQRSQEIVDAVLAQGGSARFDGRDHVMIMLNGQQRRIARTPGGSGTSARGKAREIGVRV
jgi:hypothetical protein